jgi:peroxiredoxin Q/BCP
MLRVGDPAPVFSLPDADMETFELQSLLGKNIVLFFYPRDGTPACTLEASDFSDHEEEFLNQDCVVLGVSRDDCLTHAEFRDKQGVSVRLLADPEGEVCGMYGVWQSKEVDGVKKMGVVRSTFIIDQAGVLRHVQYGVNPRGHAAEILELVKQLQKESHADRQEHHRHA